jgi:[ribosomal protein S5]-alanine N-acetyltransferase
MERRRRGKLTSIVRGRARADAGAAGRLSFPIVGHTIELRPFREDDATAMLEVYGDPEVMRWVGHGAVSGLEAVRSMLHQYMTHQELHGFAFWAVVDRQTGAVIGDGGLARTVGGEIEMGYTLARHAWGEGRGSEVAALAAHAALDVLGAPQVRALVEPENARSQRVLLGLGFTQSGATMAFGRPHLIFLRTPPGPQLPPPR